MAHINGLVALDAAMRYVKQQVESTPNDTMLLRKWCDITTKKRSISK